MGSEKDTMIVPLIGRIVARMVVGDLVFNYEPGRSLQIVNSLAQDDNSNTYKSTKYPLFALFTPVKIVQSSSNGYSLVKIPKIVLATESEQNTLVADRFLVGGTFESILYPSKTEFFNQLVLDGNIVGFDPDMVDCIIEEDPGVQPNPTTNDFIDCLNIFNLEFNIIKILNCN